MKGISTILAMILIVIIVVALIGLTYTFAVGLFSTTTIATTTSTTAVTGNMQKTVDIVAATCYNNTTSTIVTYTLRNSGTLQISGQISATLDGTDISTASIVPATPSINVGNATLNPGQIQGYNYTGTQVGKVYAIRTLTVITPAGSVSASLNNCPT